MASGKTGVHVSTLKRVTIGEPFVKKGERYYKFDDVEASSSGCFVILRIDPKGHILYWANATDATREYVDFSYVLDVRYGKFAKPPKDADKARDLLAGSFVIPSSSYDQSLLTVVHGEDFVNIKFTTFVANSPDIAESWGELIFKAATNLLSRNGSVWLFHERAYAKYRYGSNETKKRDNDAILRLFTSDRNKEERQIIKTKLTHFCEDSDDTFDEEKFYQFYRELTSRTEISQIFTELQGSSVNNNSTSSAIKKVSGNRNAEPTITVKQFESFLNREQRDPRLNEILYPYYNEKSTQRLINIYEPKAELSRKGLLSIDGFLRFLLGNDNCLLGEEHFDLRIDDMHEPLCHYYINASHNTYLPGTQLKGKSSAEIYRQVLLSGCRSVELDCYELENEPVICHGPPGPFNLVTPVLFKDVIEAIAESAFKTSSFPVVLSFENHCGDTMQARMAQYCRSIFGDMLLTDPLPSHPIEPGVPLPPPSLLRRKIIIKNRKREPTETTLSADASSTADRSAGGSKSRTISASPSDTQLLASAAASKNGSVDAAADGTPSLLKTSDPTVAASTLALSSGVGSLDAAGSTTDGESAKTELDPQTAAVCTEVDPGKDLKPPVVDAGQELSALVCYTRAVGKINSFKEADERNMSSYLYSLGEQDAYKLLTLSGISLVNLNKRQNTRIYPKGTRVDSSNYLPHIYWSAGCQMTALNFQTLDKPMQLNLGMFEFNGRCGYILKPECMRNKDRYFDPFEENSVENVVANTVTIQIISGQFLCSLSDKRLSTYVEIDQMYGLPADSRKRRFRTKTVANNGINPVYMEQPWEFKKVVLPDLAMIQIVVKEEGSSSKNMLGQCTLPVSGIRPGYRHIPLRNAANQPLGLATLFVKIGVKDFVPDAHMHFANALTNPIAYVTEMQKHEEMLREMAPDNEDELTVAATAAGVSATDGSNRSVSDLDTKPPAKDSASSLVPERQLSLKDKKLTQISADACSTPELSVKDRAASTSLTAHRPSQKGRALTADAANNLAPPMQGVTPKSVGPKLSFSSTAGMSLKGKTALETFNFNIPTMEKLYREKTVEKMQSSFEKLIRKTCERHKKEVDQLRKKNQLKLSEVGGGVASSSSQQQQQQVSRCMSSPHHATAATSQAGENGASPLHRPAAGPTPPRATSPHSASAPPLTNLGRASSLFKRAHQSVIRRTTGSGNNLEAGTSPPGSTAAPVPQSAERRQQASERAALELQQETETRQLISRQYREELAARQQHLALMKDALSAESDQMCKTAVRTLEVLYNKEVQSLMKRNNENRKIDHAEVTRTTTNKEELSKQKHEIAQKSIAQCVKERQALDDVKKARADEIETAFEQIKTELENEYVLKYQSVVDEFEPKIQSGERLEQTKL